MREHVGKAIKRLREAKGWTLDQLAQSSGVDRGTLGRIELGKNRRPHTATLKNITRALGARPSEITSDTRLLEALRDSADSGEGGGPRIEDRLSDLLDYIKTLEGDPRREFIRAVTALLAALEHARPAASSGHARNDDD